MQHDTLVRIAASDWEQLRDLFIDEWPRHEIAYHNLENYIRWTERDPQIMSTLHVYSLNDTWRENGTYIIIDHTNVFLYTLDTTEHSLKRMLLLLDWHHSYLMNMCFYRATVLEVYRLNQLAVDFDCTDVIYHIAQQNARNFHCEVPLGMTLKRVAPQFARFIYNQWLHKTAGTEYFIERMLRWNDSMGLFLDGVREPLAWCIRTQNGAIGVLGVVAQRRGYASLVIMAMARQLADRGHSTYVSVRRTNEPLRKLFEKLAFREVGEASWLKNMRSRCDGTELRKAIKGISDLL